MAGEAADLGVAWMARTKRPNEHMLTDDLRMAARSAHTGVIGDGAVFKFDLQTSGATDGAPRAAAHGPHGSLML